MKINEFKTDQLFCICQQLTVTDMQSVFNPFMIIFIKYEREVTVSWIYKERTSNDAWNIESVEKLKNEPED